MDRPLREHIDALDQRLRALHSTLQTTQDTEQRSRIETEIRIVHLAIAHYRSALDLECEINRVSQ
jgi:hypothetical protein